jgi:hypothetical protein
MGEAHGSGESSAPSNTDEPLPCCAPLRATIVSAPNSERQAFDRLVRLRSISFPMGQAHGSGESSRSLARGGPGGLGTEHQPRASSRSSANDLVPDGAGARVRRVAVWAQTPTNLCDGDLLVITLAIGASVATGAQRIEICRGNASHLSSNSPKPATLLPLLCAPRRSRCLRPDQPNAISLIVDPVSHEDGTHLVFARDRQLGQDS